MEFSPEDSSNPQDHQPCWDWKEKDWQQYLAITDSQVRDFGVLYQLLIDDPQRLEKIAGRMGWTSENWPAGEIESGAIKIPYTMHLHPVYILTRGIFHSLYELSLIFARANPQNSFAQMTLLSALHEAETQAILGIESQDMGDMTLTVCHFKRSLSQLNNSLNMLSRVSDVKASGNEQFTAQAKKRIFDLREVWLKVNNEVREEIQRRDNAGE